MKSFFKFLSLFAVGVMMTLPLVSSAQVTSIKYYLSYNSTGCYYEAHMVVTGGSASGTQLDFGKNQLTIVVPTGTVLTKVADVQPKTKPTIAVPTSVPVTWTAVNAIPHPSNTPTVDYYGFVGAVSPAAAFPTLAVNTDLILFTFTATTSTCGAGIRLWRNNNDDGNPDPGSSTLWDPSGALAPMLGADFNNSMTIGSATELYIQGNATSNVTPPNPTITSVTASCAGGAFALTGAATAGSACASPVSYAWTGPHSFTAAGATFSRSSPTSAMTGNYGLTATDANGCKTTTISCFNALSCASCIVALSVKLNTFTGTADKCNASLNWQASDLAGVRDFEVQYSSDGNKFVTVGTVNTDQSIGGYYSYHYTPQIGGKGFYRLKVVDASGTDTYSQTIVVSTDCNGQIITVSPNPTNGVVYVKGVSAGDQVKVVDMLGQTVGSVIATGNVATTDLNRLPAAVYMVIVTQGQNTIIVGQVVKQ